MGVTRIDTLGKSGGSARTGVASGSAGYAQTKAETKERVSGGGGSSSSRVIYEPTPSGIGEQAVTRIDTKGKDVTVTNLKTGESEKYKAEKNIKASEVSIKEKNIKSYAEQAEYVRNQQYLTRKKELKQGIFKGTLAEAKASGVLGQSIISQETYERSGSPIIKITSSTTPQEFKKQRDIALGKSGNVVAIGVEPTQIKKEDKKEPIITIAKSEETGYEKRIKKLQEREENLYNFTTLGGKLSPNDLKSAWSFENIGKTIARTPLNIASAPVFVGGRIALAGESLFNKQGRSELLSGIKETPKAIKQSFDVTKPEGIINAGLTLFGVKSLATSKAISIASKRAENVVLSGKTNYAYDIKPSVTISPKNVGGLKSQSNYVSDLSIVKTSRPTVTVLRNVEGGKINYQVVKVGKAQYTQASTNVAGKNIVSISKSISGKTTSGTTVFARNKIISLPKKMVVSKDNIGFTEPSKLFSSKQTISNKGIRAEKELNYYGQKGIQAGKDKISGQVITKQESKMVAKTQRAKIETNLLEPKYDVSTGKLSFGKKIINVIENKFKFVKYQPKPREVIIKKDSGTVKLIEPAKTKATQSITQDNIIEIKTGKYADVPKKPTIKTDKKISSDYDNLLSKLKERNKQYQKEIPKQKKVARVITKGDVFKIKKGISQTDKPYYGKTILTEQETIPIQKQTIKPITDMSFSISDSPISKGQFKFIPSTLRSTKPITRQVNYSIIKTRPTQVNIIKTLNVQRNIPSTIIKNPTIEKISQNNIQKQIKATEQTIIPQQKNIQRQAQEQKTIQQQKTIQRITQKTRTQPRTTITPTIKRPIRTPPPIFKRFNLPSKKKQKVSGFDVYTRKFGKIVKINKQALPKQQAINFGTFATDTTARASFFLRPSTSSDVGTFEKKGDITNYYISRKTGFFVQKRRFRISTFGEKKELNEQRRKKKNKIRWF